MSDADREYFVFRAEDERARAEAACDPNIARIHLDLATKYEELVALLKKEPPR
ncbi:MAG: hypothetical protein V4530_09355 [Pseudomonadota bacterium]